MDGANGSRCFPFPASFGCRYRAELEPAAKFVHLGGTIRSKGKTKRAKRFGSAGNREFAVVLERLSLFALSSAGADRSQGVLKFLSDLGRAASGKATTRPIQP